LLANFVNHFSGRGVLLDIEGTTSSISFVYDVMFPLVRRELAPFLKKNWGSPALVATCELLAHEAGFNSTTSWFGDRPELEHASLVQTLVERLMDSDAKTTGLKRLQGMIWEGGFISGELKAHVYDDAPPAIRAWNAAGRDVRIYSSGSVQAQKLFFGHTIYGDLRPLLQGYYDTTAGSKKEPASYRLIAQAMQLAPQDILFVSDAAAELDAARQAGLHTALCRRPGNPAPPPNHGHPEITSFAEIDLL
jgi:enolase-phosphatase E1